MDKKLLVFLIIITLLSGCGFKKILNPYESEFKCKGKGDNGKCVTTIEAYEESIGEDKPPVDTENSAKDIYQRKKFEMLSSLIDEQNTPVVVPPEIMRVLILPYTSRENSLYDHRFAYIFVTEPAWNLSTNTER